MAEVSIGVWQIILILLIVVIMFAGRSMSNRLWGSARPTPAARPIPRNDIPPHQADAPVQPDTDSGRALASSDITGSEKGSNAAVELSSHNQRGLLRGPPKATGVGVISDVFISYASQDRERAKVLAQALEAQGWSVWWDRTIPFGKRYDEIIAAAIVGARCIVVLWSTASIISDWVREEAEHGRARGILIPVLIEHVEPPMGFRLFQAAELCDWDGNDKASVFQKLLHDIAALIGWPTTTA